MTPEQIRHIYDKYHKGLVYFAEQLVGEFYAEDIVADLFIDVFENGFRGYEAKTYLFMRLKSTCLNLIKKTNNRFKQRDRNHIHHYKNKYISELPVDVKRYLEENTIEEYADAKELKSKLIERITNEIEAMPPSQKKVARLMKLGYSNIEIAEILHLSPNTIGIHVMRVRNKLRPLFSDN